MHASSMISPLLQIMGKVEVVPGDLAQPQCGISGENQKRLLPEVQYVIHAAASIQFDNPIHTDLTLSYVATRTIADFAAKVIYLCSLVQCKCCMYMAYKSVADKPQIRSWFNVQSCYLTTAQPLCKQYESLL